MFYLLKVHATYYLYHPSIFPHHKWTIEELYFSQMKKKNFDPSFCKSFNKFSFAFNLQGFARSFFSFIRWKKSLKKFRVGFSFTFIFFIVFGLLLVLAEKCEFLTIIYVQWISDTGSAWSQPTTLEKYPPIFLYIQSNIHFPPPMRISLKLKVIFLAIV